MLSPRGAKFSTDLEVESGSDQSSEEHPRRWHSACRVGALLATLSIAGVVVLSLPAAGPLVQGRVDEVESKSDDWIMTGVFTPMSLPASVASTAALKPEENTQDGNVCNDDEDREA
eukprot:Skav221911  [mRNA]  locus=scaffold3925:118009:128263:- [translate_table: standard]